MNSQVPGQLLLSMFILAAAVATIEGQDQVRVTTIREAPNGNIDLFQRDGKRAGYGVRRQDGSVDLFRPDGSRLGYIQPSRPPGGPATSRIILSPKRR